MTTTNNKIFSYWKSASWLLRIVYVNIAIFLVLRIGAVVAFFMGADNYSWARYLECPSSLAILSFQKHQTESRHLPAKLHFQK